MAHKLPQSIVIKSVLFSGYACYTNETPLHGFVFCQENSLFSPSAKIAVEQAKVDKKYVHLRFYNSNKYWARGENGRQIVAVSNKPEEDKSKLSCTLFEPKLDNDGHLYLTHVQSRKRLRTDDGSSGEMTTSIYVDDEDLGGHGVRDYAFSYVDADTLFAVPKRVAFVGDNEKYLQVYWDNGLPYLRYSGTDANLPEAAFEVHLFPDGHIRIKSAHLGKFWRRGSNDWMHIDSTDDKDKETLFWPVTIDNSSIALRCLGNNHFSGRGKDDYLGASFPTIVNEAKLVIHELVLERKIYNVRYRMEDARVYDEEPYLSGTGVGVNPEDTTASLTVKVPYEISRSYTFSKSFALKLGTKLSFEAGIPFVAKAEVGVSLAATFKTQWGETRDEKEKPEASYTVVVPARTQVKVDYIATRGKCDIPFSYTQRDTSSTDGKPIITQHVDGIFRGVSMYNFRFEHHKTPAVGT